MTERPSPAIRCLAGALALCALSARAQSGDKAPVVLEDFSDMVTIADTAFNDFAGNMGVINARYATTPVECSDDGANCWLNLNWNFTPQPDAEVFTGFFASLFGLTDTRVSYDGQTVSTDSFPEHSLDLDNIDGALISPDGPRRFEALRLAYRYQGAEPISLRVELKDAAGGGRFKRYQILDSAGTQALTWDFHDVAQYSILGTDLDLHQAKRLNFIIERENHGDGIRNPDIGALEFHSIGFIPDRPLTQPSTIEGLVDLAERTAFQYFLDWTSRKPASQGIPQDRSTTASLLTTGGVGFGLPAYVIGASRGWMSRMDAAARTLKVLKVLREPTAFGPELVGRVGYHGWFYHFLGTDGRRKQNFDFPETPENEALDTVEVSAIDTGLALIGILAAQSYFDGDTQDEKEIRSLAQGIYDTVDFPFLLEPNSLQFYLGWLPNEPNSRPFAIPDSQATGVYSGASEHPQTLDFSTDEAFILTLLAVGSETHPVSPAVHCAWGRKRDERGLIRSFPGALFTYQFLHAFVDARTLNLPACSGEDPVDWFENSQAAIQWVIDYATRNTPGFLTYGPKAWGISAAEGPDDAYHAYGAVASPENQNPEQDGTVTYYSMLSSISYGDALRTSAIEALQQAWIRGHWHYRFGLPDAFNDDISWPLDPNDKNTWLRQSGTWKNPALFAIDQGPMLLHLENARSGLIWNLLAANGNIQRSLARLRQFAADRNTQRASEQLRNSH